jgi:transcription elongation factor Elf1
MRQKKPSRPRRRLTPVAFRRLASCAPVRAAPLKPCGRPCSPCGCENRGAVCAPVCLVDKSVSRDVLRCAACRGDASRLARLIREGSRPVNVTSPPFAGILAGVREAHRRRVEARQSARAAIKDCPNHGRYALRQVQITGPARSSRIGATQRRGKCLNDILSGGFDVATGAAHH